MVNKEYVALLAQYYCNRSVPVINYAELQLLPGCFF